MTAPEELANIFKVFSVDTRIQIIEMLKEHPLCVGAISARLNVTQGAVSQHLRILRDAGLVVSTKRGYFIHYQLHEENLAKWKEIAGMFLSNPENNNTSTNSGGVSCVKKKTNAKNRKT